MRRATPAAESGSMSAARIFNRSGWCRSAAARAGSRTRSRLEPGAAAAGACEGRVLGIFQPPLRVTRTISGLLRRLQTQFLIDHLFCQDLFIGLFSGPIFARPCSL